MFNCVSCNNRKRMKLLQVIAALALVFSVVDCTVWTDEFDTFDSSKWYIEVNGNPYNNELEYYTDSTDNIYVEDGHLVIKPIKQNYGGRQYTSGRMHTNQFWKYGRIEAKIKLPNGYGLWPAFWMMPEYSVYGGWPNSGEIDILEARGQDLRDIQSTIHYQTPYGHQWTTSGDVNLACDYDTYHTYSVDWTPTELVYRFDGTAYYKQDISGYISATYSEPGQPFDQDFYIILNVAIGGDYLDGPDPSTVWNYPDAEMHVDYVHVYDLDEIATSQCVVVSGSNSDVCGNVNWACYDQNYADVSAECTQTLLDCCDGTTSCSSEEIDSMASAVYTAYDDQLNSATSCDFSGTASRRYVLNDGDDTVQSEQTCEINDDATNKEICGSLQWACYDNTYVDVSAECYDGADGQAALDCCNAGYNTCDDDTLRTGAGEVFEAYYAGNPVPSSCDFGGVCSLSGSDAIPCA